MTFFKREIIGKAAAGAMGRTASAAGGASNAAVQWSKNLSKIPRASWEAGRDMFGSMSEIDFDKGSGFMRSITDFFKQMGFFGKIMEPIMRLLKILDAALIEEYSKEIVELNEALSNEDTIAAVRWLSKAFRFMAESNDDLQVALKTWELIFRLFIELGKYLNQMADGITESQQSTKMLNFELDIFNDKIKMVTDTLRSSGGESGGSSSGIPIIDYIKRRMEGE